MDLKKGITVPADMEHLEDVMGLVQEIMYKAGVDEKQRLKIEICVEEMYTNIASYAYENNEGKAEIKCHATDNPNEIVIEFSDSGKPYNPLEKDDPDINAPIEERPIGGLGIYMTKKMMDSVSYEYKDGKNVLLISKTFT